MKKIELKCQNCGLTRKISYSSAIYSLIKKGEIQFPCSMCCYDNHFKLKLKFWTIFKEQQNQKKFIKRYKKYHK